MSSILAFLISKGVNTHWHTLKKKLKGNNEIKRLSPSYRFMDISQEETERFEETSFGTKNSTVTNQIIKDFLFLTREHSNDVILHYPTNKDLYVLKEKKSAKPILFNLANQ